MKSRFHLFAGTMLLAGCAPTVVQVQHPHPIAAAVAGRPVVYRTGCPERLRVDTLMMADFTEEFPGQKPDDSDFQALVGKAYSGRIASTARTGRFSLDQTGCDTSAKSAGVGFTAEGTRLLLDTAGLDTGKVYIARSPIRFVQADSAVRSRFLGSVVPDGVKLIDAEMSFGIFDPRARKVVASGELRGLSSTGSTSRPDVIRDDWYSAAKRLAAELENRLDSMLAADTAAVRR